MAKIITVAHQKGGVGKSTLTLNLALFFADNAKVAILDYDPQGTINALATGGMITKAIVLPEKSSLSNLVDLPYDFIFIDTPPYLSNKLSEIFGASDVIIVPTKASYADIMAIRATIDLIKDAAVKNKNLKAFAVLNMIKPNTTLFDEIKVQIEQFNIPLFHGIIHDRVSYVRSLLIEGVGNTGDDKALNEIGELASAIVDILSE
jgi:chromosome partitioning protein